MKEMTTRERVTRMLNHQEADRIPITDHPWNGTIKRWHREGMPEGMSFQDYFDIDHFVNFSVDVSPRFPYRVLEETEDYIISTSDYGVTMRHFKHDDSTPEFLDFTYNTSDKWQEAKEKMTPTADRINWKALKENAPRWEKEGYWRQFTFWFGFDVTHSWCVGTETLLIAMLEEPEWVEDMFNHYLEMNMKLYDMIWEAGYRFDSMYWYDDMGYKNTPFFSTDLYREILKPYHKRAVNWAHEHGVKAELHSCGYIMPHLDDLMEVGIDILNPIEVKAGMDPIYLKEKYGDRLTLHGGVNAVLWDKPEEIFAEMERVIPVLKQNGGYIFSSDHSIPNSVSLEDFRKIVAHIKELGKY